MTTRFCGDDDSLSIDPVDTPPAEHASGVLRRVQGKTRWTFSSDIGTTARAVLATFGDAVPAGRELAARLNALADAEALGATHVPADHVEGTGLVVDAGPYAIGVYDRFHAIGFRATWAPFEEAVPETCWFQHDPGGSSPFEHPSHARDCGCHGCVCVCCCGEYARDHNGYENHGFCGAESYARNIARGET